MLDEVRAGSIVMLHDGLGANTDSTRHQLVDALPTILDGLEERGLRPVGLSTLLRDRPDCS